MSRACLRSGKTVAFIVAAVGSAACYAAQQAPPGKITKYNPPPVNLSQVVGNQIDLNALRASWNSYPTGYSHTRPRNQSGGGQGSATITPYRGISNIGPNKPPTNTVLFARISNLGTGADNVYNLKPSAAADYYVIVDADPASPGLSRWRILEVPNAANGKVTFVQRAGADMFGHLNHCAGHTPKPVEEADFWSCDYGDIDHASAFSTKTALASLSSMPFGHEFWDNVFATKKKGAPPGVHR